MTKKFNLNIKKGSPYQTDECFQCLLDIVKLAEKVDEYSPPYNSSLPSTMLVSEIEGYQKQYLGKLRRAILELHNDHGGKK